MVRLTKHIYPDQNMKRPRFQYNEQWFRGKTSKWGILRCVFKYMGAGEPGLRYKSEKTDFKRGTTINGNPLVLTETHKF